MENRNSYTREAFIKELGHARKIELANMVMDGASIEDMNAAGFSRINIQEMYMQVKNNVTGFEDIQFNVPRTPEEEAARDEQVETANANAAAEKKSEDQASVPGQIAGEATVPEPAAPEVPANPDVVREPATEPVAPEGAEVTPAVDAAAPGTDQNYDETLGGNKTDHDVNSPDNAPRG